MLRSNELRNEKLKFNVLPSLKQELTLFMRSKDNKTSMNRKISSDKDTNSKQRNYNFPHAEKSLKLPFIESKHYLMNQNLEDKRNFSSSHKRNHKFGITLNNHKNHNSFSHKKKSSNNTHNIFHNSSSNKKTKINQTTKLSDNLSFRKQSVSVELKREKIRRMSPYELMKGKLVQSRRPLKKNVIIYPMKVEQIIFMIFNNNPSLKMNPYLEILRNTSSMDSIENKIHKYSKKIIQGSKYKSLSIFGS